MSAARASIRPKQPISSSLSAMEEFVVWNSRNRDSQFFDMWLHMCRARRCRLLQCSKERLVKLGGDEKKSLLATTYSCLYLYYSSTKLLQK
jgi:hypothetical protein